MLAQQTCFANVGAVIGIVGITTAVLGVPLFGWDVVVLRGHTLVEALGAAPDGHELGILQRRLTLRRTFHESVVGFLGIAVSLEHAAGEMRHGAVAASFGDRTCAVDVHVPESIHVRIRVVHLQTLVERDAACMELDFGFFCTEEKPSCIQRPGIEIRKDAVDTLLQIAVLDRVGHFFDQEQHMELGTRSLATLYFHAVSAEMNGKGNIRECSADILRGDPILRVFGMIIVTVHTQTGRGQKVRICAITFFVGNAYIVTSDNLTQDGCIRDNRFMRVAAIAGSPRTIGKIQLDFCHQ